MQLRRLAIVATTLLSTLSFAQSAPPTADTYSDQGNPAQNYGSQPTFWVGNGNNGYLQFNLATLPSGINVNKATLRLYVNDSGTGGSFNVYQLNTSWSESTLNWGNAPSPGELVAGPISVSEANQFVEVDITSLVQGWANGSVQNNGLVLELAEFDIAFYFSFDSKENTDTSHQPELEIVLDGPQ